MSVIGEKRKLCAKFVAITTVIRDFIARFILAV